MVSPALNDHELPRGQPAVGRQRFCLPPLDRTGVRSFSHGTGAAARGNFLLMAAFPVRKSYAMPRACIRPTIASSSRCGPDSGRAAESARRAREA